MDFGRVAVLPDIEGRTPFFSNNGLLLRVQARFSGSEFESSVFLFATAGDVALLARVEERSVRPKYSSLGAVSVGEGEVTSGVLGTGLRREDMM